MSSLRLETFSDGVFAIAVTLLALQLRPPDLDGVTTVGGVLHALAFVVVGGLWLEHHQLLDPMQTHGRRLARTNLLFLLTVAAALLGERPGSAQRQRRGGWPAAVRHGPHQDRVRAGLPGCAG
jgi:hypothetical protein